MSRIAFVTNFCPHYRKPLYERLGRDHNVDFLFFSQGKEKGWNWNLGRQEGSRFHYLKGLSLPWGIRLVGSLYRRLLTGGYDLILKCTNGRLELVGTFAIARLRRTPFVLWHTYWKDPETLAFRLANPLLLHIQRSASSVVVIGPHIKEFLVGKGIPAEKIFVAWQATDNDVYRATVTPEEQRRLREELSLGDRPVVLYVGRFDRAKGLDVLISAMNRINDRSATLVFVGDGPLRADLEQHCRSNGVDHRFVKTVPPSEIRRYYAIASTLVLPSVPTRTFLEPWGLVLNEAMNQRVPVIATTAVGAVAAGLVRDGETGLVVPAGSDVALADALNRLLGDPSFAASLGERGFQEVASFNYDRMQAGFESAIAFARAAHRR